MNIKELLIKQAQNNPEKCAIIFEETRISFSQLKDTCFRLANYLLESRVKKGDKAAIFLPNSLEAVFSFLGSLSIGVTVVPMDFMLTEEEVINFINHSQAKVLITQLKKNINLANIKNNCPKLEEIIIKSIVDSPWSIDQNFTLWNKVIEEGKTDEPQVAIEEESLSSIFYTSGSTGHPKGVSLEFKHLDNPPRVIDYFLGVSSDDVFLCGGVPFSHVGGFDYILLMLYFSSTIVVMERFHPFEFLKNIEAHQVTIFCIVPTMYVAILSLKETGKFNLSSLRFAVVFGAPSSPVLLRKFQKLCPNARLSNGWGMTETAAPNCMLPVDSDRIESIGKFTPWMQARIVDEQGGSLGAGTLTGTSTLTGTGKHGELWVKGEAVMRGYYREVDLTAGILTNDGWLKTGDIAYCDKQGLFYIVGRKKDMLKVAGEIVFPAEVEEKINCHPKVKEAAVIGVSDNLRGEVPKAFIAAKDEQCLEEQELREYLKEHLAHFKIPHYFEFIKELPKNRTGKIDKQVLRKESLL